MKHSMAITALTVSSVFLGGAMLAGAAPDHHGSKTATTMSNRADIVDTAVAAGSFKTLAAALKAADLVDALKGDGPFTVFAPTDEAFAQLPAGTVETLLKPENKALLQTILKYHVVSGKAPASKVLAMTSASSLNGQRLDITIDAGKVMVDNATVIKTDVMASNGVIHVIDRVILPSTDDIIATAVKAGSFNTLATAIQAAGLVEALQGAGPFTVFAPTDEAFSKLPAGTVESLLEPANRDKLVAILKYHVVSGRVFAADALAAQSAETLEGRRVRFGLAGGQLQVNGANIVQTDVDTTNGVIHIIDEVILPN